VLDLARSNGLPSQKSDILEIPLSLMSCGCHTTSLQVLGSQYGVKWRLLSAGCVDMSPAALSGACVVTVSLATSLSVLPEHASIKALNQSEEGLEWQHLCVHEGREPLR